MIELATATVNNEDELVDRMRRAVANNRILGWDGEADLMQEAIDLIINMRFRQLTLIRKAIEFTYSDEMCEYAGMPVDVVHKRTLEAFLWREGLSVQGV